MDADFNLLIFNLTAELKESNVINRERMEIEAANRLELKNYLDKVIEIVKPMFTPYDYSHIVGAVAVAPKENSDS